MSRDVHRCTHWLRPRNSLPPPAFGLVLRGRYWSAKIDDISLWPPGSTFHDSTLVIHPLYRKFSSYKLASLLNILTVSPSDFVIIYPTVWLDKSYPIHSKIQLYCLDLTNRQLKGSIIRDFQNQADLANQSPSPTLKNQYEILRNFAEIFVGKQSFA
jgi:hypothetical protein